MDLLYRRLASAARLDPRHQRFRARGLGGVDLWGGLGRGLGVGRGAATTFNHASHPNGAVRCTEVGVRARLRESVLIYRAYIGKHPRVAVGVIR